MRVDHTQVSSSSEQSDEANYSTTQTDDDDGGLNSTNFMESKLEALHLNDHQMIHHEDPEEELLHNIDHFLGVPNDVWIDHLFCFLTTNQLLKVRLITKSLSKLVWFYFRNFKTTYAIRVGTSNGKFSNIVDHFLVHLKKLRHIRYEDYNLVTTLALTDFGFTDLGRITTPIETLDLSDVEDISGSFLGSWGKMNSVLTQSLRTLRLYNTEFPFFTHFKHFKNLQELQLLRDIERIDYYEEEIQHLPIELPESLTHLTIHHPLVSEHINSIIEQCPNLTSVAVSNEYLRDKDISALLKGLPKLEKFKIIDITDEENDETHLRGKFYSTFKSHSFKNLKYLSLVWIFNADTKIVASQKNLGLLPSLETLKLIMQGNENCIIDTLVTTLASLTTLTSLSLLFKPYMKLEMTSKSLLRSLASSLTKLARIEFIEGLNSAISQDFLSSLIGSSLEALALAATDMVNIDFSFLKKCLKLIKLRVDIVGSERSLKNIFREFQTQAKLIEQKGGKLELPLRKVSGATMVGGLIPYIPRTNITKLSLFQVKIKDLMILCEFKKLTSLRINISEKIDSFKNIRFPESLKKLYFDLCPHITGLEPGFVENLLSLTRLRDLHFIECKLVCDEFVEQMLPLNDYELRSIFFEEVDQITNNALHHLTRFTNCEVIVLKHCPNIITNSDYSIIKQENPQITVIFSETENEETDVLQEFNDLCEEDWLHGNLVDVYNRLEKRVKDLTSSRQLFLAHCYIRAYLVKDHLSAPNLFFLCYNYLDTLQHGINIGDIDGITLRVLNCLDELLENEHNFSNDEKEKTLACISKCLEFLVTGQEFAKACEILLRFKKYKLVMDGIFKLDEVAHTGGLDELISTIIDICLDGTFDLFDNYPTFYIIQTLDSFVQYFSHIGKTLDLIHHVMKVPMFRSHSAFLTSLDAMAKRVNPTDNFAASLQPENMQIGNIDSIENVKQFIPPQFKDHFTYVATVKVPKDPSHVLIKHYRSEAFEAFGYLWTLEFGPNDSPEENEVAQCSLYLTLLSTKPTSETSLLFDHIKLHYMLCNHDFTPGSYLVYTKNYKMASSSYGDFFDKRDVKYYSKTEEYEIYKFVVCMKIIDIKLAIPNELNPKLPPWILNNQKAQHPLSIHTVTVLSSGAIENGDDCYSDPFEAFGFKWGICFYPKGETKSTKADTSDECSIFLALLSFDINSENEGILRDELEYVKVRFLFANESYDSDSIYIGGSTYNSLSCAGNSVYGKELYAPITYEENGKIYSKYVINVAIQLVHWKRRLTERQTSDEIEDPYHDSEDEY
ncbi:hypothetical protein C9374_013303 [Naegleria lovaniensis]|uniref:MATH domain-containing protein n=1 Tax=Naegleria lovaniensis TaxID=51637 RepID=A0AA88GVI6_NAELO|nr:uncharacterized protein C9374_013303 [Naegleria lovaniensis]KAG2391818.1 hypothetical protein C9374_013303 [Naegleria lovaniensis]